MRYLLVLITFSILSFASSAEELQPGKCGDLIFKSTSVDYLMVAKDESLKIPKGDSSDRIKEFMMSRIKKVGNKITVDRGIKVKKSGKNEMRLTLGLSGKSQLKAALGGQLPQANVTGKITCECQNQKDRTCWLESDSKDNSVECQGADCCSAVVDVYGVSAENKMGA